MKKIRMISAISAVGLAAVALASCSIKKTLGITDSSSDTDTSDSSDSGSKTTPVDTTTITGEYAVSFYVNGTLYKQVGVNKGESVEYPIVPEVEGYDVVWEDVDLSNITKDITVNAILTAKTYKITYKLIDKDGNTSIYKTEEYKYGTDISAPIVEVEDGYVFSGWNGLPSIMSAGDLEVTGSILELSDTYDISLYSSGTNINIKTSGTYQIIGTNEDVSFSVSADDVVLVVKDVISTDLNQAFISSSNNISITFDGDNTITSSSSFSGDGLITSTAGLSLQGSGKLSVTNNNVSGACLYTNKSDLNITSGEYNLSSAGIGIQAKGAGANINISGGNITSTGAGASIKAKVKVSITAGTINITSTGADGINADNVTISNGNITIISKQDGIQGDTNVEITGGVLDITSGGGKSANAALTTSSSFTFEIEDTSSFTTADEYYGLYILSGSTYIEITEDNYQTYQSQTTFYDRVGCKGIKSDELVEVSGGTIKIDALDDGIKSSNQVLIKGGNISITSQCDGIQGDSSLSITGGTVDINTIGTFYSKSGGAYTKSGTTYKRSDSGSYDLYNSGKGLKSETDIVVTGGTITTNTVDDSIHSDSYVTITGGTFNITTLDDGIHADTTLDIGGTGSANGLININVLSSFEGLESGTINIYSGTISVYGLDDGINAGGGTDSTNQNQDPFSGGGGHSGFSPFGSSLNLSATTSSYSINIYGGLISVRVASGDTDAIDSNGSYTQSGGVVVSMNSSTSGTATVLDTDGSATITGGLFIGFGKLETTPSVSNVKKQTVSVSVSAGENTLYNSSNDTLITFSAPTSYTSATFVGPSGTYTLKSSSSSKTITIS